MGSMEILMALAVMLMAGFAWLPWLLTGLHPALAVALALNAGVLVAGVVHVLATLPGLLFPNTPQSITVETGQVAAPLILLLTLGILGLAFLLRKRFPLLAPANGNDKAGPVKSAPPEDRMLRLIAFVLLVPIAAVLGYYLWANALRPPILAGTIFTWSAPAREGAPLWPATLAASALYYKLAISDAGWKFFWALLSLTPWLAVAGALRQEGRGLFAATAAVGGLAGVFSLLFWGSAAYPDVFLAGSVFLLGVLLSFRGRVAFLALIPAAVLLWSGWFWIALGGVLMIAAALQRENLSTGQRSVRHFLAATGAAAILAWLGFTGSDVARVGEAAAYLLRDAWNPVRYGVLMYGIAALAFRYAGQTTGGPQSARAGGRWGTWELVWLPLAIMALVILDVSARSGMAFELLLRFEGNRALSAGLVIAWCWAWFRGVPEPSVRQL
jgi:hypothetical protein